MRQAPDAFDGVIPTTGAPRDADMFGTRPKTCRILANFGTGYD